MKYVSIMDFDCVDAPERIWLICRNCIRGFVCTVLFSLAVGCSSESAQESSTPVDWLTSTEEFANLDIAQVIELEFPRDHGIHEDFRTEWWYLTAVLSNDAGREFGIQFTLFRQALVNSEASNNPWRAAHIYMGHVALSDVRSRQHMEDERFARGHLELAGVASEPFRAYIEDWILQSQTISFFPLVLDARSDEFSIHLEMESTKPVVLQGDKGLSHKSPEHSSYYYSIPRIAARGVITLGTQSFEVSGDAWLDREWSNGLLGDRFQGWYWFALSLDDGRDLVLFSLLDSVDGSDENRVATVIDVHGEASGIAAENWFVKPLRYWKQWPVEWLVSLPDGEFRVVAAFDDQEMNTSVRYWEGLVRVVRSGKQVGKGYMELTGYALPKSVNG